MIQNHDLLIRTPSDKLQKAPFYSKDYIYSIELDTKEPSNFHAIVQHVGWMNDMQ
jgi:hypothetical protein